jgi:hypothetical protein
VVGKAFAARRTTSVAIGDPPWANERSVSTRRGRANCSSTIPATIVGTPSVAVTPSASITSSAPPGSKAGRITWRAPT